MRSLARDARKPPSPGRRWPVAVVAVCLASVGPVTWRLLARPDAPTARAPGAASAESQLVEATFPPKLPLGKRWTVEVEGDVPTIDGFWKPRRARSEVSVAEVGGDLVMVDARDLRFDQDHVHFVLRPSTLSVVRVQTRRLLTPSLDADLGWERADGYVVPACDFFLDPSHLPILYRSTAAGEVLDVLGERNDGAVRQRAWVEDGLVRFELQPRNRRDAVLTIAWRPGDPWWAKYECFVPGKSDNRMPPRRDGSLARPARARLVAVDGVPVEPLPWEHPPADWMSAD